jgi:prefoldin subunit 5
MGLTQSDLQEIRSIMYAVLEPLANEITALRNDIKEIYNMISELQSATITDKEFKKRSLEEKLLTINAELLSAAKQAGIVLPRN